MDGVSADIVARSTDMMNQVLKMASASQIDLAEKMVKVNLETALASQPGMGDIIDVEA